MKLEKREITLNEKDSLSDIAYMEKALLFEYVEGIARAGRKETRERLLQFIKETALLIETHSHSLSKSQKANQNLTSIL